MRPFPSLFRQLGTHPLKRGFLCLLILSIIGVAAYAVPGNDNFANAQLISGLSGTVNSNNTDATTEANEPDHDGITAEVSVWYRWTAPSSGNYYFSTLGSDFDTVMAAYTGSTLNTLTQIASNDENYNDSTSRISFNATANTVYFIAVDGYDGVVGDLTLSWGTAAAPPANDNFADAQIVSGASGTANGTNVSATAEANEPEHGGITAETSVWYRWTAPSSGNYYFSTSGSDFDTVMAAYTGSTLNTLTQIASNDENYNDSTSRISFNATANTVYFIAVDGYDGVVGDLTLSWGIALPPANDNFADAQLITGASGTTNGSSNLATAEAGEPDHDDPASMSVWYRWTAPSSGLYSFDIFGSGFDAVLAVYSGTALNTLTKIASVDDSGSSQSEFSFAATGATQYWIAVDGYDSDSGNIVLNWATAVQPVVAVAPGYTQNTISWDAVPGTFTYKVSWRLASEATSVSHDLWFVNAPSISYIHSGLANGTTYFYKVKALGMGFQSLDSDWVSGTPLANMPGAPGLPAYSNIQTTSLNVGAPAFPINTTSLTLQKKLTGGEDSTYVDIATGLAANSAYNVTGLVASTAYTFRFRALGAGGVTSGLGTNVSTAPPVPSNDNFADAQLITGTGGTANGSNNGATAEAGEPWHNQPASVSVWYRWTAPSSEAYIFNTSGSNFNTALAIYSGTTLNALTRAVTSNSVAGPSFPATAGTQYWIAVDGIDGSKGNIVLNWAIAFPAPTGLSAIAGDGKIDLTWTHSANSASYRIKRSTQAGGPYLTIGYKPATGTATYSDTSVSSGTYYYVVEGGSSNWGAPSNEASATLAPANVTFSGVGSTGLNVHLPQLPTSAQSFTLYRATQGSFTAAPTTSNRLAWFRADSITGVESGSPISAWSDLSGNGVLATPAAGFRAPRWIKDALNGRPALRFDGIADGLNLSPGFSDFSSGLTAFVLAKPSMSDGNPEVLFELFNRNRSGNNSEGIAFYLANDSGDYRYGVAQPNNVTVTGNGIAARRFQTLSVTQASNGDTTIFRNGVSVASGNLPLPVNVLRKNGGLGHRSVADDESDVFYDHFFGGDIAEILIYNRALTPAERTQTENYLTERYNVSQTTPTLTWTPIATGLASGATYADSGLSPNTTYWYKVEAVGPPDTMGLPASVTTTDAAPAVPNIPAFSNVRSTVVTVTPDPAVWPSGAKYLKLQQKPTNAPNGAYVDVGTVANTGAAPSPIEVSGLATQTSYSFRYVALSDGASTPGPEATVTTALPTDGGSGGLLGVYYFNKDFTNPAFERLDSQVNFDWRALAPRADLGAEFSIRWMGQIQPEFNESYTFRSVTDSPNRIRLWINGTKIIEGGDFQASAPIVLVAGQKYEIQVEFVDNEFTIAGSDVANVKLEWESASQPRQVMPSTRLFAPLGDGTGLRAQYFNDRSFGTQVFSRTEPQIANRWATGQADPRLNPQRFATWWTGQLKPQFSETYTFTSISNEGMRVWVNNQLVIDSWQMGGDRTLSSTISLTAEQLADVKVAYYGAQESPTAQLLWSSATQAPGAIPRHRLYPAAADSPPPNPPSVLYDARLISVSAPSNVLPGRVFPVTLKFKNSGTKDWHSIGIQLRGFLRTPGTTIAYGAYQIPLPYEKVDAGDIVTFNLSLTAPTVRGTYGFFWNMEIVGSPNYQWSDRAAFEVDIESNLPAPKVLTVTGTKVRLKTPTLPGYASSFVLQRAPASTDATIQPPSTAWAAIAPALKGDEIYEDESVAFSTPYWYRVTAQAGAGATAETIEGEAVRVATPGPTGAAPDAPGAPASGVATSGAIDVTAPGPNLPARATSLKLQIKLPEQDDGEYADISGSIEAGAVKTVGALSPETTYRFRFVSVGPGGITPSTLTADYTTAAPLPDKPGVPQFEQVTATGLVVEMPELPARATSLTLQIKDNYNNAPFVAVPTGNVAAGTPKAVPNSVGLEGRSLVQISGLIQGSNYSFRAIAVGSGGATEGDSGSISTSTAGPKMPLEPRFRTITSDSVEVIAPNMPEEATSLTLQGRFDRDDAPWSDIVSTLGAGSVTPVGSLSVGQTYAFRYVAYGPGGWTPGLSANVTLHQPLVVWRPGSAIECQGIRFPDATAILQEGQTRRLSAFLGVDWDARDIYSGDGTRTERFSDACVYVWTCSSQVYAAGGGFVMGNSLVGYSRVAMIKSQNPRFVMPSSGLYANGLTLTVDDQGGSNKGYGEGGARNDAAVGFNDDPLKFIKSLSVLP